MPTKTTTQTMTLTVVRQVIEHHSSRPFQAAPEAPEPASEVMPPSFKSGEFPSQLRKCGTVITKPARKMGRQ